MAGLVGALLIGSTTESRADLCRENHHSQALLIGNKDYWETFAVPYAHNDVAAMERFLVEKLCYRKGNIKILKNATFNGLRTWLGRANNPRGRLWDQARKGQSNIFVYYSGHGVPDARTKKAYLLPIDAHPNNAADGYELDQLDRNLSALNRWIGPKRTVTLVVDSCFSGRSAGGALQEHSGSFTPVLPSGPGVIRFTASQANQLAYWQKDTKQGLFTSTFLDAVSGKADKSAGGNRDGVVSGSEIRAYLADEVPYRARRLHGRSQTPTLPEEQSLSWRLRYETKPDKPTGLSSDALFWASIKDTNDIDGHREFLKSFPKSPFAGLVRRRLARLSPETGPGKKPDKLQTSRKTPPRTCKLGDHIFLLADYVIKNRGRAGRFGRRRIGATAYFLKARYGRKSPARTAELISELASSDIGDRMEVVLPFAMSRLRLSSRKAMSQYGFSQNQLDSGRQSSIRARILVDNGKNFLREFERGLKDPKRKQVFRDLSYSSVIAHSVIDQSDEFKARFAEIAIEHKLFGLAGFSLATMSELDSLQTFIRRHRSERYVNLISGSLDNALLSALYDTGPNFMATDKSEKQRRVRRDHYTILRASYFNTHGDFLNIFHNQTGKTKEISAVAKSFLREIQTGRLDPDRNPDAAWLFLYRGLVRNLGQRFVDDAFNSFDMIYRRHYDGRAIGIFDWLKASKAIRPYLLGQIQSVPAKPRLSASFDWNQFVRLAEKIRERGYRSSRSQSEFEFKANAEILFQAEKFNSLLRHFRRVPERKRTKFHLDLARDFMIRFDQRCDQTLVFPGRGVVFINDMLYRFPKPGQETGASAGK